jgi:hypothetical protein
MPELRFQKPELRFQKPELRFQMPKLSFQMPKRRFRNPQACYLVMASSNSTLLIKPVVMEELMLPSNFPSLSEKTSQQSTEIIEDCLDMVCRLYSLLYCSYLSSC